MERICTEYRHATKKDLQKEEICNKLVPVTGVTLNLKGALDAASVVLVLVCGRLAERTWI